MFFQNLTETDKIIIFIAVCSFTVIGGLQFTATLLATSNKLMRAILLLFGILGILIGAMGIFSIMNYKYCHDYIVKGDIERLTLKERDMRRERKKEFKQSLQIKNQG